MLTILLLSRLDVDGATWVGQQENAGGLGGLVKKRAQHADGNGSDTEPRTTYPYPYPWQPVTVAAAISLIRESNVSIAGKEVLVVGRSRLVGLPLTYALSSAGATVTISHTETPAATLRSMCERADVVFLSAGSPGLVSGHWLKNGATLINIGTTYDADSGKLLPDFHTKHDHDSDSHSDIKDVDVGKLEHLTGVASCPGGVGPIALPTLLLNVVESAELRVAESEALAQHFSTMVGGGGADANTGALSIRDERVEKLLSAGGYDKAWHLGQSGVEIPTTITEQRGLIQCLVKEFDFDSHAAAIKFITKAGGMGDEMEHHVARLTMSHRCTRGVAVRVELYTLAVQGITAFDADLAASLDDLHSGA